jgi:hypothetical protein
MTKIEYLLQNGVRVIVLCEDDRPFEKFPKISLSESFYPYKVQEYDNKGNFVRSYECTELDKAKRTRRKPLDPVTGKVFQKYYHRWKEETASMAFSETFDTANYKAIVNMGWDAVPHIIEQFRKKPVHLFKALMQITGVYPIKAGHVGLVDEMAGDWIEWYDSLENFKF